MMIDGDRLHDFRSRTTSQLTSGDDWSSRALALPAYGVIPKTYVTMQVGSRIFLSGEGSTQWHSWFTNEILDESKRCLNIVLVGTYLV